jgi:hypothetical protein
LCYTLTAFSIQFSVKTVYFIIFFINIIIIIVVVVIDIFAVIIICIFIINIMIILSKTLLCGSYGGTNVQQALATAVSLKQPVYGYPVSNLTSMKSLPIPGVHGDGQTVLRDCLPLRPGTTVTQFFDILCNCHPKLLTGDFVRAEVGQFS